MTKDERFYPVLIGFRHGEKQIKVWCPWCVEWHVHGQIEGHRVAHCNNMTKGGKISPFHETGYIIKFANINVGHA